MRRFCGSINFALRFIIGILSIRSFHCIKSKPSCNCPKAFRESEGTPSLNIQLATENRLFNRCSRQTGFSNILEESLLDISPSTRILVKCIAPFPVKLQLKPNPIVTHLEQPEVEVSDIMETVEENELHGKEFYLTIPPFHTNFRLVCSSYLNLFTTSASAVNVQVNLDKKILRICPEDVKVEDGRGRLGVLVMFIALAVFVPLLCTFSLLNRLHRREWSRLERYWYVNFSRAETNSGSRTSRNITITETSFAPDIATSSETTAENP